MLTFHPHPHEVLVGPGRAVLTPLARKLELLSRLDAELVIVVEEFTRGLSELSPAGFVEAVLQRGLGATTVVVGNGFRFGRGRRGDLDTLRALGSGAGFSVIAAELVADPAGPLSSSRIRTAIELGDLRRAEMDLTRPHALAGRVVHGDGRGRQLGFPTANLSRVEELLPPYGVYACLIDRLEANGRGKVLGRGVMNLGVRPTLEAGFGVEVHVFDFAGDLYGADLRVHLLERLRDERRFVDVAALAAQIEQDIARAQSVSAARQPDPDAGGAWH